MCTCVSQKSNTLLAFHSLRLARVARRLVHLCSPKFWEEETQRFILSLYRTLRGWEPPWRVNTPQRAGSTQSLNSRGIGVSQPPGAAQRAVLPCFRGGPGPQLGRPRVVSRGDVVPRSIEGTQLAPRPAWLSCPIS